MLNTEFVFFLFEYIIIPSFIPITIVVVLKTASLFHTNPATQNPNAKLIKVKELDSYLEQVKKEKIKKEVRFLIQNYNIDVQKQKEFFRLRINGENFNEAILKLQITKKQTITSINTQTRRIKTL